MSISRMLDMGGAPSARNDGRLCRTVNASKNSKLQVVVFDFDVLTRSVDRRSQSKRAGSELADAASTAASSSSSSLLGRVAPDTEKIQQIAGLRNVDLGGSGTARESTRQDDLSLLLGNEKENADVAHTLSPSPLAGAGAAGDIRLKYAKKLATKGLHPHSVDRVHHSDEPGRGDAADHLAARKLVASEPVGVTISSGGTRWMAQTGTGSLLQYLTQRSIRIVLVPPPTHSEQENQQLGKTMDDFVRQLKSDVVFDLVLKEGQETPETHVAKTLRELAIDDPKFVLFVSDREDYLRAAKNAGLATCRIRPPKAPRGNLSTPYVVPAVPEVREVVNDINGISFNAVLKGM